MSYKKRNYMVDNIKVLLIFSVVFGHVIEYYIKDSNYLKGIYIFIYIFHMPLFIFISGYLSKNTNKSQKGAFKNLLIPYIFFNMLWYTVVYIGTKDFMFSLIYPGWTLWYLISLFFWRISLKYLVKIKYIITISFVIGLIIGLLPKGESILSISRTITFLPFFLLGYFSEEKNFTIIKKMGKINSFIVILVFIAIAFYIAINDSVPYEFLYNSKSYFNMGLTIVQGVIFRSLLYLGAILLSICIINFIPNKRKFYTHIGEYTMNIYVFHIYLILIVFFFIPNWDIGAMRKMLLLISPICITYILSSRSVEKFYDIIFNIINKHLSRYIIIIYRKKKRTLK